jgi:hypothetical protein
MQVAEDGADRDRLHSSGLQERVQVRSCNPHVAADLVERDTSLGHEPTHDRTDVLRYSAASGTVR